MLYRPLWVVDVPGFVFELILVPPYDDCCCVRGMEGQEKQSDQQTAPHEDKMWPAGVEELHSFRLLNPFRPMSAQKGI